MVGDVLAFFHAHGERFLVRFQDLHLEVVVKLLVLVLPSVRAHQVLEEGRFFSNFGSLAIEFGHMHFAATMCILPRLLPQTSSIYFRLLDSQLYLGQYSDRSAQECPNLGQRF